ncbi:Cyclin-T2 [Clonorchis sinensis]|uniref:Cyclin-T2 n=3 Tax=Opisthorchiidae TaxID=6196 RepID=H2KUS4_CLOSI|nr:Cyclin-T2 [Clonorchis sinensis]GAA29692.2 cyclin-T2 [Clonorchis sinensis]
MMEQCQAERNLHLARRQQCACLIQELGSRLQTTQVVINAGIYYMHHFYEVFSPETIKPILVAIAAFYCACKTEDFSRKLAFLIKATYEILKRPVPNEASDTFKRLVQNIHALEATILMVIGFQTLEVKQPHVLLINAIRANKFPKEISHTSYYICTNILHLTTLILRHSAEAIAAASLYIAAKWNSSDIQSPNGEWYHIFSPNLTFDEISKITEEFTLAFQACDLKIKEQLRTTLRSRKLQREQKEQTVVDVRNQELQKKPLADTTQPTKPDSWKAEKRPYNQPSGQNLPQSAPSHHQTTMQHHQSRSHQSLTSQSGCGPGGGQNYPYHAHHRPPPSSHQPQPHGGHVGGAGDHFNRSHLNRPQSSNVMMEPDSKRARFDRSYSTSGRHSPVAAHHAEGSNRTHRYDGAPSHFPASDSMARHGAPSSSIPPGRPHDYRVPQAPGYSAIPNKPSGRDEQRSAPRPSAGPGRVANKPGAHPQNASRPMNVKHDFNDYF